MTLKRGRPTLYNSKMIRRTYQITEDQDLAIKKIGAASGESDSAILRDCIETRLIRRQN